MKILLISYCTEYEFGQRPDGVMIGEDIVNVMKHIEETHNMGSQECFWRYSQPKEVYCSDNDYTKIKANMNDNGLAFYHEDEIKLLNLFEKL